MANQVANNAEEALRQVEDMKLSEAMKKGIAMTMPLAGRVAERHNGVVYACALGAAGVGVDPEFAEAGQVEQSKRLWGKFGSALEFEVELFSSLYWYIGMLNDRGEMTRDEIATFVAELGY